jgi:hypothetical protein
VLAFIDRYTLFGRGIGYSDAHLLAAVRLTAGAELWTRDKRLHAIAVQSGLAIALPQHRVSQGHGVNIGRYQPDSNREATSSRSDPPAASTPKGCPLMNLLDKYEPERFTAVKTLIGLVIGPGKPASVTCGWACLRRPV